MIIEKHQKPNAQSHVSVIDTQTKQTKEEQFFKLYFKNHWFYWVLFPANLLIYFSSS